jgi:hypothetical protein
MILYCDRASTRDIRPDSQLYLIRRGLQFVRGQGLQVGRFVLTPLHVIDRGVAHQARGQLSLHSEIATKRVVGIGPVVSTLPNADCTIFAAADGIRSEPLLEVEPEVRRGDRAVIDFLQPGPPHGVRLNRHCTTVDDLLTVSSYKYHSASGDQIRLTDANIIVLRGTVPVGVSGAPVWAAETGRIIGLVHGTSPEMRGTTLCLSPLPIVAELDRREEAFQHEF